MKSRRWLLAGWLAVAGAGLTAGDVLPKPLVVVLVGPPASGKSTQADYLDKKYGLPVISVEDLVAADKGARGDELPRTSGRLDELLKQRLEQTDIGRGFVLDGYPATRAQADHLGRLVREFGLPDPIVIQIHVPDKVVRERCAKRGGPEDAPEIVSRRLARYHEEMDMLRAYYPEADIWTIDGTRGVKGVSATIRVLIEDRMER